MFKKYIYDIDWSRYQFFIVIDELDLKLRLREFAKIKSRRSTAKELSDLACSTLALRPFLAHFFQVNYAGRGARLSQPARHIYG